MKCRICSHEFRDQIEKDCLETRDIAAVAEKWHVPNAELQKHMLLHTGTPSLVVQTNVREANAIAAAMNTNSQMLQTLHEQIVETIEEEGINRIAKPVVDLFLGCSKSIYDGADALVRLHTAINGPKKGGTEALANLIKALEND